MILYISGNVQWTFCGHCRSQGHHYQSAKRAPHGTKAVGKY